MLYTESTMRRAARVAFFTLALPALARAALRCAWLERRLPLDELVERLRDTRPFALPTMVQPLCLLASLDRVLPLLPPWCYGTCLKRSLLLLDLWSRCGLRPRLHLGVRLHREEEAHLGHAWVTVQEWPAVATEGLPPATSAQGYPEAFVF